MGGPGAEIICAEGAGKALDCGLGKGGSAWGQRSRVWSLLLTILLGK